MGAGETGDRVGCRDDGGEELAGTLPDSTFGVGASVLSTAFTDGNMEGASALPQEAFTPVCFLHAHFEKVGSNHDPSICVAVSPGHIPELVPSTASNQTTSF